MQSLKYPVMLVTPNYILGQITTKNQLTTVGEVQFENGCFENGFIVDSDGFRFEILSALKVKRKFSLLNYDRKYRSLIVKLDLSEATKIGLEEFKKQLADQIIGKKWYGSDIGVSSGGELRDWLGETQNFRELIMISDVFS